MAPKSRKRAADSYDDDGSGFAVDENDAPKAKKARSQRKGTTTPGAQTDDEGNVFWEISHNRRITVSTFKGKSLVSIREFYEKDGKQLPGKKGISMTTDQFSAVVSLLPELERALKEKDETLPRPVYDPGQSEPPPHEADSGDEGDGDRAGKQNFEATSEED